MDGSQLERDCLPKCCPHFLHMSQCISLGHLCVPAISNILYISYTNTVHLCFCISFCVYGRAVDLDSL